MLMGDLISMFYRKDFGVSQCYTEDLACIYIEKLLMGALKVDSSFMLSSRSASYSSTSTIAMAMSTGFTNLLFVLFDKTPYFSSLF